MALRMFLSMLLFIEVSLSQDNVRIDCGSQTSSKYWVADEGYIATGEISAVQHPGSPNSAQLNTLRVFTKKKKSCYKLPTKPSSHLLVSTPVYLIRASFYYGNYDGLSNPPTFDLEFEGKKWATVETSNTQPQFYELLYHAQEDSNVSICLVETKKKEFPFINALELWSIDDIASIYDFVNSRNFIWLTSYRYSYGASADDWILGYPDDEDDRIWEPNTPAGLNVVSITSYLYCTEESLPDSILSQAVEAPNPTDTIELPFAFNRSGNLQHYMRAFFSSNINESVTRTFGLYVNDDYISTITTDYYSCTLVQAPVHSNGTLNVQLRPNGNSTSLPFISGIEIYTAISGKATNEEKKKKDLGLLIGLPVGLILGLTLPGLILLLLVRRPKTRPTNGQATTTSQQQEANPQQSVELEDLLELHMTSMRA